ncbi:MAG: hypothetical protein ACXVHR_00380 [Methanobacterium sp.]
MNIRVIIVVLLICLFALSSTMLTISVSSGQSLDKAYTNGNIKVLQKSDAGTIPHEIEISNNGNSTINVKKGNALASSASQDLVIAEDKQIATNSTGTVKAYCIEPSQRAVAETKLLPVNNTYYGVNKVLSTSNPYNPQNAYETQLKIWVIMSGGNLNPYTGEPVAVVEDRGITWTQFRQDIAVAKNDIMKTFNVNESGIQNLNQNPGFNPLDMVNDTINWIKSSLGIQ